jgi:ribosome-associated protein
MAVRVNDALVIPDSELQWRFSRSSGPGGQGVNTTDSRVQLRWSPSTSRAAAEGLSPSQLARLLNRLARRLGDDGVLQVEASAQRSQLQNREAAEQRLSALVAEALAPPPRARRATRPTRGSIERRITGKKHRSSIKKLRRDYDQ